MNEQDVVEFVDAICAWQEQGRAAREEALGRPLEAGEAWGWMHVVVSDSEARVMSAELGRRGIPAAVVPTDAASSTCPRCGGGAEVLYTPLTDPGST